MLLPAVYKKRVHKRSAAYAVPVIPLVVDSAEHTTGAIDCEVEVSCCPFSETAKKRCTYKV